MVKAQLPFPQMILSLLISKGIKVRVAWRPPAFDDDDHDQQNSIRVKHALHAYSAQLT